MENASPGAPDQPGGPPPGSAPPPPPFPNIPGYPGFPGLPGQPQAPARKSGVNPWVIAVIAFVAVSLVLTGVFIVSTNHGPPDVSGTWTVSLSGGTLSESGTMSLREQSIAVTGSATLSASDIPGADNVSGTLLGQNVTLDIIEPDGFLQLNGSLADSAHMSGTFTFDADDGSPPATGTWTATKTA